MTCRPDEERLQRIEADLAEVRRGPYACTECGDDRWNCQAAADECCRD